jgi:hypothetical protein
MPAFVVAGIEMLGAALLGWGAGAIGAAVMFYATEIATAVILAGGLAYSSSQKSKAARAARAAFNASQVDRMVNVASSVAGRELVLGRVRKGGAVFFKGATGTNNDTFVMCLALAAHEIDAVETVYLNDVPVTLDGSGYVQEEPYKMAKLENAQETFSGSSIVLAHVPEPAIVVVTRHGEASTEAGGQYNTIRVEHTLVGSTVTIGDSLGGIVSYQYNAAVSKVRIRSYLGTSTQTADATLISLFPTLWTSAHRARGVAYLVCEFTFDETAFPSGLPSVSAIIRGAKLYDPRTATTVWSENPALLARHVMTHPQFGKRASITAAEDARITAAANVCDTSTVYTVDGVAQTARALYTASIVLPFGASARDALDDLAQAMAGQWAYAAGEFYLRAGGYTASVGTLTDTDLAVVTRGADGAENQSPVQITTHKARDQMFNVVTATIWDAAQDYKQSTLTPLKGAALITRDGAELVQDVSMPAVSYAPQALHIAGIMLRDARDPLAVVLPFKLSAYRVELFDTISLTLARYGWTAKTFMVLGREWAGDGSILLTLKETTAAIFTMDADFDPQGHAENTALPSPWDITPPTITSVTSRPGYLSDGSLISEVLVQWTPLTDAAQLAGQVEVQWLVPGFEIQSVRVPGDMSEAVLTGVPESSVIIVRARILTAVAVSGWSAQVSCTVPAAGVVPANYDTFTVTLAADNTRIFTFAYTTTTPPIDLAGAVIRFKKGAVGTELWAAMSPLHEGVLTNSPIETTAGDPDVYRFAIKARTRSGIESSDATVHYVDIVLPAIGADQIVAILTTPIFSVPSSSSGVVTTFTTLTGTFRVYYNGVLTTAGLTWSVQSDPSSLGVTIDSGTGVYSLAFPGSPSGWWTAATPSATVRLRAALTADPAAYREIDLVVSKSMAGADAQAIKMNTTAGSMSYDTAGTAYPAAQTITLTLTRIPTSLAGTATWVATAYDSTLTSLGTVTLGGSGDTRTLTSAQFIAPSGTFNNAVQYVNVVATLDTLTANQGIVRLTDGQEAIISFLTNPAVTLPASSAGVVTSWAAATGTFQVWQGNTNVTSGITYAIQSNPSTLWATIHATTGVYSVSGQTSWADASGSTSITFRATHTASGAYRDAVFTLAKAVTGAAGAPGTVPDSIRLDASVLAFSFDTAGTAYPAAQSSVITLTREPGTIAGTATWSATAFDSSGGQIGTTGTVGLTGSGDSRTLTTGNFIAPGGSFSNNVYYVNVTATLGALSKTVRVIRITDGVEPILSFLTAPSVTLPASSAGVVSSWAAATGDFQVWQGGVEVTSGITYAIQSNPSTLTASINSSTGVYSVTASGSWANGSNTTSITFRATHTATGATRDAVLTLAKALAGGTGSAGAPGADAVVYEIEPSPSSVSRNNIGVATPSSVTFAAYSKTGSAARVAFSGRFTIETFIDPTWTGQYTSVSNESSKTYTVPASVTAIRVKLYANGSLSPLLQQVTVPVVPDGIRSPMTLNSNSSATAVYGTVTSGAVNWTDAKGNEVVWRKLGYTSAPSATPADYLVRTDLVTLFDANPPTAGVKPATRYWTGSAWADPGAVIDGNLLVKGTVTLDAIKSGSTISTSGVSFGLGVSWGPGSSPSGGYFHSTVSTSFALVADNVAGGYSIASATTATNDSGAAFVGGGGWTGYTTSGGVTSGGTYATTGFIATGTAGGIFRYGSTAEARLGETTGGNVSAGRFTQGSYVGLLGTASAAVKASYSTTQVVSLGTSSYAVDITAGSMRYNGVILDSPPASANYYLNGNGDWKNLLYLGTGGKVATWDGSAKPGDNNTTNTWAQISISGTEYLIPVWAI